MIEVPRDTVVETYTGSKSFREFQIIPEWDAICGDRIPTFSRRKFAVSSVFARTDLFVAATKLVPPLANSRRLLILLEYTFRAHLDVF